MWILGKLKCIVIRATTLQELLKPIAFALYPKIAVNNSLLCRDISTSMLLFFYLQSWQAMFVILITVGSVSFFTYVGQSGIGANLNWTLVSFVVLLPSVLLLYLVSKLQLRQATP